MHPKTSLKWLCLAVIFGLSSIAFFPFSRSEDRLVEGVPVGEVFLAEQAGPGIPIRLRIPEIGIDTAIESVGLTPKGAIDVPKDFSNAAWFSFSSKPGEKGTSIIDGHSGWKNGVQSIFDNLYELEKGDKIYVEDGEGTTAIFVVRKLGTYSINDDVSEIFMSNDEEAHLNLITCSGPWNKNQKSPNDKLVLFAEKEI